jgi:hypothetical protein
VINPAQTESGKFRRANRRQESQSHIVTHGAAPSRAVRDFRSQARLLATNLFLQRCNLCVAARRQDRDFAGALVGNDDSHRLAVAFEQ